MPLQEGGGCETSTGGGSSFIHRGRRAAKMKRRTGL